MNAIVDMIAEGIICKDCREWIDGEAPGYERNCGCISEYQSDLEKNDTLCNNFIKNLKGLKNSIEKLI